MKIASIDLGFNVGTLALGAGVYLLGPTVLAIAGGILKGAVKSSIKAGIIAYDKGKQLVEEARESIEDLTEEAKSEVKASAQATQPQKAQTSSK